MPSAVVIIQYAIATKLSSEPDALSDLGQGRLPSAKHWNTNSAEMFFGASFNPL